jgi:hypothetical protein
LAGVLRQDIVRDREPRRTRLAQVRQSQAQGGDHRTAEIISVEGFSDYAQSGQQALQLNIVTIGAFYERADFFGWPRREARRGQSKQRRRRKRQASARTT